MRVSNSSTRAFPIFVKRTINKFPWFLWHYHYKTQSVARVHVHFRWKVAPCSVCVCFRLRNTKRILSSNTRVSPISVKRTVYILPSFPSGYHYIALSFGRMFTLFFRRKIALWSVFIRLFVRCGTRSAHWATTQGYLQYLWNMRPSIHVQVELDGSYQSSSLWRRCVVIFRRDIVQFRNPSIFWSMWRITTGWRCFFKLIRQTMKEFKSKSREHISCSTLAFESQRSKFLQDCKG